MQRRLANMIENYKPTAYDVYIDTLISTASYSQAVTDVLKALLTTNFDDLLEIKETLSQARYDEKDKTMMFKILVETITQELSSNNNNKQEDE